MSDLMDMESRRLKYTATINDEALPDTTDLDYELQYIDIGNVDSQGAIQDIVSYRFEAAPSRARRIVRDGDVIVSTVRTYLQAIAPIESPPDDLIVSTGFAVVRPVNTLLDRKFCKYVLREKYFLWEVESRSTGVSYPAINTTELGNIFINLPSLSMQRSIANYLDRETTHIDTLIAEKEHMLSLLKEKRAALISQAVTRGLDPDVPLKPSGLDWLGDIPAHWSTRRLKYLTNEPLAYGANESALEDNKNWPRFVRITDINQDGSLREETFKSLHPDVAEDYLLDPGDVLFARSGATVGKSFIYKSEWGMACFAGYLIRFRSDLRLTIPDYIYYFSLSDIYWQQVKAGMIQATIQNFSADKYGDLITYLPPLDEQKSIVKYIKDLIRQESVFQRDIEKSIELLKERRSTLITAAVTGQIDSEDMVA